MLEHTEIILVEFEIGISRRLIGLEGNFLPPNSQVPTFLAEVLVPHIKFSLLWK
jgi:hypothetical protein